MAGTNQKHEGVKTSAHLADLAVEVFSADARARGGCVRARRVRLGAPAVRLAVQGQKEGLVRDALPLGLGVLPQLWRVLRATPLLSLTALPTRGSWHAGLTRLYLTRNT